MKQEVLEEIRRLSDKYGFIVYVVADPAGNIIEIGGDQDRLKWKGLFEALFGDKETIARLSSSLEGQLLPRTWGQGDLYCLVCKPSRDALVGFFGRDKNKKGAAELYERYKEGQEISAYLTSVAEKQ
jgi:hypothetical protein